MVPVSSPQCCWQEGSTSCSSSLVRLPVLQKTCWCFSSLFRSLTWLSIKLAQLPGTLWIQQQSLALDLYSEAKQEEHKAESSSLFPSVLKSRCQDPLVKYLSPFVAPARYFSVTVSRKAMSQQVTAAPTVFLMLSSNRISLNTSLHMHCGKQSLQSKIKQFDVELSLNS